MKLISGSISIRKFNIISKALLTLVILTSLCVDAQSTQDDLNTSVILLKKARTLADEGHFPAAIENTIKAVHIRENALGRSHPETIESLNLLGDLYTHFGKYSKAEEALIKARITLEKSSQTASPQYGNTLHRLGVLYYHQGRYTEAEQQFKDALALFKKHPDPSHRKFSETLNSLGNLYREMGRFDLAEPLLRETLESRKHQFGLNHPDTVTSLNNLALLYHEQKLYDKAEKLYLETVAAKEKLFGKQHYSVAVTLHNLGFLYYDKRKYDKAEEILQRSLAIQEHIYGLNSVELCHTINALGMVFNDQNKYDLAEKYYKRDLQISLSELGEQHILTLNAINNLSVLYSDKGNLERAEALHLKHLKLCREGMGKSHPETITSLQNLAMFKAQIGDNDACLDLMLEAFQARKKRFLINYVTFNESEKLLWYKYNQDVLHHPLNFLHLGFKRTSEQITNLWEHCLFLKGLILTLMVDQRSIIEQIGDQNLIAKFNKMNDLKKQYAEMYFDTESTNLAQHSSLQKQIEIYEKDMSSASVQYVWQQNYHEIELEQIQELMPEKSLFLDYYKYRAYNYQTEQWQEWRYGLFSLAKRAHQAEFHDIGAAEPVELAIRSVESAIRDVYADRSEENLRTSADTIRELSTGLYKRLLTPVVADVEQADRLLVSPDGVLNMLPFDMLRDENGAYLYDKVLIQYLSNGKDLITYHARQAGVNKQAVVIASPYFGNIDKVNDSQNNDEPDLYERLIKFFGLRSAPCDLSQELIFSPLPETKREVETIIQPLKKITSREPLVFIEKTATEAQLKKTIQPSILHLASHGFFLGNCLKKNDKAEDSDDLVDSSTVNPLLLSGIALAKANETLEREPSSLQSEDGLVTALEITQLDLRGTDLVVLSACETGRGKILDGEGVYGLRRAFELAGARTILVSLWKAPDRETAQLMQAYYEFLAKGKGKLESLRLARRKIQKVAKKAYKVDHPLFWSSFIAIGEAD